jgi:hypothetical protein
MWLGTNRTGQFPHCVSISYFRFFCSGLSRNYTKKNRFLWGEPRPFPMALIGALSEKEGWRFGGV